MTFASDLSTRIADNPAFKKKYASLSHAAAKATLGVELEEKSPSQGREELYQLLYSANIFAQTDDEDYRSMAQSIALNAVLLEHEADTRDRALRLLIDLGNFPALTYAEKQALSLETAEALSYRLRKSISKELNAISIGGHQIALTDFQKLAWDSLPTAKALAISAPTSAGKSFLVIEYLCRTVLQAESFTAVYVAPTRALLSEVQRAIKGRIGDAEGVRVSTVPSVDVSAAPRQIYVLTQERLQVLLAISSIEFDAVIVDEAQNISDGSRGMILQECLEQVLAGSPNAQLIMLAPGVKGFNRIAASIGLKSLQPATSKLPAVLQNRILVEQSADGEGLTLKLLTAEGAMALGTLSSQRGFDLPSSRLAAVALELGDQGGSLVYATGPSEAETVALQISQELRVSKSSSLDELGVFIEKHIHPRYGLASLVRKGVAFHYGKMPTLLREAIEQSFKSGEIRFLACTTTLFQGVNLPARNVFIDTPTRGSGARLDPAAIWNFAGRAGRMKMDVVGNVFLVDYADWPEKPMDTFVEYRIEPAFEQTLTDQTAAILTALSGDMPVQLPRDEVAGRVRAATGLLISRAARGDVESFLARSLPEETSSARDLLSAAAIEAIDQIELPASLLATNWTVDPFGLRRLYNNLVEKIQKGEVDELIPLNPHGRPKAEAHYAGIFIRIQKHINRGNSKFAAVVASTAVRWMQGQPYPRLLARAVTSEERRIARKVEEYEREKAENPLSKKRRPKPLDVNGVIRKTFDMIEDIIRFQYVQLGKAYIDVLSLALHDQKLEKRVKEIFDFPLALELGVSTRSGWSFMELGLSRIAASALEPHFPNTNLSVTQAKAWLDEADLRPLKLSPIILEEIHRLGLNHSH